MSIRCFAVYMALFWRSCNRCHFLDHPGRLWWRLLKCRSISDWNDATRQVQHTAIDSQLIHYSQKHATRQLSAQCRHIVRPSAWRLTFSELKIATPVIPPLKFCFLCLLVRVRSRYTVHYGETNGRTEGRARRVICGLYDGLVSPYRSKKVNKTDFIVHKRQKCRSPIAKRISAHLEVTLAHCTHHFSR